MSALPLPYADGPEEKFQRCRDLWIRYMRTPDNPRWYPRSDATCRRAQSNRAASIEDKDYPYTRADLRTMHTFNACVDSLLPHERSAVYKAHGLGDACRYARVEYEVALASAMRSLRRLVALRC